MPSHAGGETLTPLGQYFSQLGYVVTDTEKAVAAFEALGVTGFKSLVGGGDEYLDQDGKRAVADKVKVTFGQLGPIQIELVEPLSGGNIYTEFLERSGPGLHHTGFAIPDHDEYRAQYQRLLDAGAVLLKGRRIEGSINVDFAYFDCSGFQGGVVELMHFF